MDPSHHDAAATAASAAIDDVLRHANELSEADAHDDALVVLQRALEIAPDWPKVRAKLHAARGWALENLRPAQLAEARAAYEAAVALDAGQLWAWAGLATVLGQLGHASRCPAIYRDVAARAAVCATQEPEFIELLGWCQYRLGQLDEAAATFRRALAVDAAWISVRFDLGLVLLVGGDAAAAIEHYRGALRSLAGRAPAARSGPLKVARDDLDDALREHPSLHRVLAATGLREQLERVRDAGWPGHG